MTPHAPINVTIRNMPALRRYQQRARRSKTEVLGILIGYRKDTANVYITDILYPDPADVEAFEDCIYYDGTLLKEFPDAVGTIHSHPDSADPCPSPTDIKNQAEQGEIVYAIYAFYKPTGKTRMVSSVRFYCGSPDIRIKYKR